MFDRIFFPPLFAQTGATEQGEAASTGLAELGAAPYWVLAGYLLLLLVLGLVGWLKSRSSEEDYYLAGRGQNWAVSSLTIMATFFSSFALLGAPGMVYRDGVVFALFALNVPVGGMAVYLLGAKIWRLGRHFRYVTPGDMVAHYYGGRFWLRLLVAITGVLYAIPYVVMQIQAGGLVSQELFGQESFTAGAVVLAGITMLYIMIGGMRSVAWTDVVQGILLITGMLVGGMAMMLLFQGPGEFARKITTELPATSLTAPGNRGQWTWTNLLTVCVLASTGSMVQPAQWMRYYSADSARSLKRAAVIFALLLTACFIFGVMLIGMAGQVVYPLRFEVAQSVDNAPAQLQQEAPDHLKPYFRYQGPDPSDQSNERGQLVWTWNGKDKQKLTNEDVTQLQALSDSDQYKAAVGRLQSALGDGNESTPPTQPTVHPNEGVDPQQKGDFDSILVVMLTKQMPRVLGQFGAVFASVLIVAIMAASMSTADSNLHALSALVTRDVYGHFLRPRASDQEKVWVGRFVILLATVASLAIVFIGRNPTVSARYDFLQMIAKMGLMAIAFSAQLLPIVIDILFLRKGTSAGAAAGLAAGLIAAFLCGDLFALLASATLSEDMHGQIQNWIGNIKFAPMHGSVWGLAVNVPIFVLVSLITRGVPADRRAKVAEVCSLSKQPD